MKSCGTTQRNNKMKCMNGRIKKVMGIYWWMNGCFMSYLTIRKHAPRRTAFILTSKSMGKLMPKLSVSVSDSLIRPVHCLLIRPTGCPSLPVTCTRGQTNAHNLWSNYSKKSCEIQKNNHPPDIVRVSVSLTGE